MRNGKRLLTNWISTHFQLLIFNLRIMIFNFVSCIQFVYKITQNGEFMQIWPKIFLLTVKKQNRKKQNKILWHRKYFIRIKLHRNLPRPRLNKLNTNPNLLQFCSKCFLRSANFEYTGTCFLDNCKCAWIHKFIVYSVICLLLTIIYSPVNYSIVVNWF